APRSLIRVSGVSEFRRCASQFTDGARPGSKGPQSAPRDLRDGARARRALLAGTHTRGSLAPGARPGAARGVARVDCGDGCGRCFRADRAGVTDARAARPTPNPDDDRP